MTQSLYLREITQSDLPRINQWRQDHEIIDQLGDGFRFVNLETENQWFENYQKQREHNIRLAICLKKNDLHIGNIYLLNLDFLVQSAVFHILLGDKNHYGKGYGKQATLLCLEHGFFDRNLQRISLTVLTTNQRAINLYEKCGFVKEGLLRRAAFKNGKYIDVQQMAVLRDDFLKHSAGKAGT